MTDSEQEERKSSTLGAAINLSKLCIGTGVLALPYATSRGGLLFGPLVIAFVAAWNGIACKLMIECKNYCKDMTVPQSIGSTYGRIAYVATGVWGVRITDISIVITLLGVCIAYQITFASLIYEIPGNFFSKTALTILSGLIVLPFSISKDVGYLSTFSFFGLICLMIGVFAILFFGIWSFGGKTLSDPFDSVINDNAQLTLFPKSLSDATIFVGIATFCFGLASLAFPIEESMEHKEQFQTAVIWSLVFVWSVYVAIGDLAALLYFHDPNGINGNILTNLPENSLAASMVRLSMALVCVLTFPLTFVAPAQIIEFLIQKWVSNRDSSYQRIYDGEPDIPEASLSVRIGIRVGLIILCTFFASAVPCFGMVISLLGCFTVAILSFVLPPLFHLYIIVIPKLNKQKSAIANLRSFDYEDYDENELRKKYYLGIANTFGGIVLSIVATSVTAFDVWSRLSSGAECS